MILDNLELEHLLSRNACVGSLVETVGRIESHSGIGVFYPPYSAEYNVGGTDDTVVLGRNGSFLSDEVVAEVVRLEGIFAVSVCRVHICELAVSVTVNHAFFNVARNLNCNRLGRLILSVAVGEVDVVHLGNLLAVIGKSGVRAVKVCARCNLVNCKYSVGIVDCYGNACSLVNNVLIRRLCGLCRKTENRLNVVGSSNLCCAVCEVRTGDIIACLNLSAGSLDNSGVVEHILVVNLLGSNAEAFADNHIILVLEVRVVNGVCEVACQTA